MRVVPLFIFLLFVGTVLFVVVVQPPFVVSAWYSLKGYGSADTPEEAVEKFNKALDERNYSAAARYLDGEAGLQLKRVAGRAEALGKAVDNFRHVANDHNLRSDKIDTLLLELEPFPRRVAARNWKKSEGSASVVLVSETGKNVSAIGAQAVAVRKVDGDWRLVLPWSQGTQTRFTTIEKASKELVEALDDVKNRMKRDATLKEKDHLYDDLHTQVNAAWMR